MNLQELLTAVREVYRNAFNPNQPIASENYLAMLQAFGVLLPLATVPDAYDTDFRRNLPGGGLAGLQVVSLAQCVSNAGKFANSNDIFPAAGEGIAENIRAILGLIKPKDAADVLVPFQGTFQNILAGNL